MSMQRGLGGGNGDGLCASCEDVEGIHAKGHGLAERLKGWQERLWDGQLDQRAQGVEPSESEIGQAQINLTCSC
jgi:hypothetical protein